jgi:regulator of sigma D
MAERVYPRLLASTEKAVEFNDRYEHASAEVRRRDLPGDLSRLGEELALRFEIEDRLFTAFLQGR